MPEETHFATMCIYTFVHTCHMCIYGAYTYIIFALILKSKVFSTGIIMVKIGYIFAVIFKNISETVSAKIKNKCIKNQHIPIAVKLHFK